MVKAKDCLLNMVKFPYYLGREAGIYLKKEEKTQKQLIEDAWKELIACAELEKWKQDKQQRYKVWRSKYQEKITAKIMTWVLPLLILIFIFLLLLALILFTGHLLGTEKACILLEWVLLFMIGGECIILLLLLIMQHFQTRGELLARIDKDLPALQIPDLIKKAYCKEA